MKFAPSRNIFFLLESPNFCNDLLTREFLSAIVVFLCTQWQNHYVYPFTLMRQTVLDGTVWKVEVNPETHMQSGLCLHCPLYTRMIFMIHAWHNITKTYLYDFDLKPHFYIEKLGFTEVTIIFHISVQTHGYSLLRQF